MRRFLRALLAFAAGLALVLIPQHTPARASTVTSTVFRNPIGPPISADPSVDYANGNYYETLDQFGSRITIARAQSLLQLKGAPLQTVWTAGESGTPCCDLWAPTLEHFNGHFYIYFTATDGPGANRRMYVVESDSDDAMGPYHFKARIYDPSADFWAIDGDAFIAPNGAMYFVWSGWPTANAGFPQNIYIAPMSNPWTLSGARRQISTPDHDWEQNGAAINEAPAVLQHDGHVYITYSASGGNTSYYVLGLLSLAWGQDPYTGSWSKNSQPVMTSANGMCAPGSNSFFKSPDGTQDWIAYHARTDCSQVTWDGRTTSTQQVTYDQNDAPVFPAPVNYATDVTLPSGDPGVFGNEIANGSFEDDQATGLTPSGWQVWAGNCGCDANAQFTEDGGGPSGGYHLAQWMATDYQVYTYQTVRGLTDGWYQLSGWIESTGGQNSVFLGIKNYQNGGGPETTEPISAASDWTSIQVPNVYVSGGQATVGLYSQAPGNTWVRLDDVQLTRVG